jgi:hypothetical protein
MEKILNQQKNLYLGVQGPRAVLVMEKILNQWKNLHLGVQGPRAVLVMEKILWEREPRFSSRWEVVFLPWDNLEHLGCGLPPLWHFPCSQHAPSVLSALRVCTHLHCLSPMLPGIQTKSKMMNVEKAHWLKLHLRSDFDLETLHLPPVSVRRCLLM